MHKEKQIMKSKKMKNNLLICGVAIGIAGILAVSQFDRTGTNVAAADILATTEQVSVNPLKDAFFGDLHLHTALSPDANLVGATLMPEDSYKYAMGEEVTYLGRQVKRIAPLDFLAVTDHSEYIGVTGELRNPKGPYVGTEMYKLVNSTDPKDIAKGFALMVASSASNVPIPELTNETVAQNTWQRVIRAADTYNKPGKFTAMVGYEWTSAPADVNKHAQNLHRCVIFKGSKVPSKPFTSFDSDDPENLWTYLENARKTGDDVLAVPHNGNVSNGLMFDTKTLSGKPLTREYAERRMNNEPLTEANQGKGQSETHPTISPNDEFANYELYEVLLSSRTTAKFQTGSYIRQAYGVGQEMQAKIGANPFKYGLEGGTDYHTGISGTEENNYPGSHSGLDDMVKNYQQVLSSTPSMVGEPMAKISAAGLTGVWAESNTRESIFDALKRKETFATSGVRIKVRLFAGWNFKNDLVKKDNWVKQAYESGVPMGADLTGKPNQGKPRFVVQAVKDPNSGNLDRVQIIKVSTKNGKSSEKIFDVVWSGNRKIDASGKLAPVGNTVNIKAATYTNTIGAAELFGFWEDKEFDPGAYVTYYARVIEIPTPRWSTYLAAKHNMDVNSIVASSIQERAWTSPIWYTPAN